MLWKMLLIPWVGHEPKAKRKALLNYFIGYDHQAKEIFEDVHHAGGFIHEDKVRSISLYQKFLSMPHMESLPWRLSNSRSRVH